MNARQQIIKALYEAHEPTPIHSLGLVGVSETAASARLREMAREGIVAGFTKPGARYKLWILKPADTIACNSSDCEHDFHGERK